MAGTSGSSSSSSTGSPCGACKFLRRKCAADCIFAPYFWSEQGPARFAAIHKVFGASNVSKLLVHVPVPDRAEAVLAIAYEAQARIRDPVYGCVAHIFALQQQVAYLQAQVMQMKAQLSQNYHIDHESPSSRMNPENNHWPLSGSSNFPSSMSLDTIDRINSMQCFEKQSRDTNIDQRVLPYQPHSRKRPSQTDLTDLQQLALRMMNNEI